MNFEQFGPCPLFAPDDRNDYKAAMIARTKPRAPPTIGPVMGAPADNGAEVLVVRADVVKALLATLTAVVIVEEPGVVAVALELVVPVTIVEPIPFPGPVGLRPPSEVWVEETAVVVGPGVIEDDVIIGTTEELVVLWELEVDELEEVEELEELEELEGLGELD